MRITATNCPLVIRYRSKDRYYSSSGGEADPSGSPFDEVILPIGQVWEGIDVSVIGLEELGAAPQMAGSPSGPND